jgi:hypothetical protein
MFLLFLPCGGKVTDMRNRPIIFSGALLLVLLMFQTPQFAQDTSQNASPTDLARHRMAVSFLRALNTAKVVARAKNGAFLPWKPLLTGQPGFFGARFLEINGLEKTVSQVSDEPEVLPGWNLRLNVHEDGRGYDVLLIDKRDKACSYAALTDQSGVIRQSKAIDCEI